MTLRKLAGWIVGVPLLLIMIVFALSNSELLYLRFFPLGQIPVGIPASVAILAALGLGYFLGGLRVRIAELRHRRAARQAEETVRLMEARQREVRTLPRTGGVASHL